MISSIVIRYNPSTKHLYTIKTFLSAMNRHCQSLLLIQLLPENAFVVQQHDLIPSADAFEIDQDVRDDVGACEVA